MRKFRTWLRTKMLGEIPKSATMEEWDDIDARERTMPIRYFLVKTIPLKISVKMMQLRDVKYWFKYRLQKEHKYHLCDTGLPPAYYEIEKRMLHANFNMLKEFVETELADQQGWRTDRDDIDLISIGRVTGLEHLDWQIALTLNEHDGLEADDPRIGESTPQALTAQEIKALYLWWVDERPNRPDPWDLYNKDTDYGDDKSLFKTFTKRNRSEKEKKASRRRSEQRHKLEEKYIKN